MRDKSIGAIVLRCSKNAYTYICLVELYTCPDVIGFHNHHCAIWPCRDAIKASYGCMSVICTYTKIYVMYGRPTIPPLLTSQIGASSKTSTFLLVTLTIFGAFIVGNAGEFPNAFLNQLNDNLCVLNNTVSIPALSSYSCKNFSPCVATISNLPQSASPALNTIRHQVPRDLKSMF